MNRLEKLKLKLAEKHYKESGHVPTDWALINFYSGFDAASAEYEKIIAELEGALDSIVEIDLITHKMHPEYEGQFSEYADKAREVLQKLKEFRGGE